MTNPVPPLQPGRMPDVPHERHEQIVAEHLAHIHDLQATIRDLLSSRATYVVPVFLHLDDSNEELQGDEVDEFTAWVHDRLLDAPHHEAWGAAGTQLVVGHRQRITPPPPPPRESPPTILTKEQLYDRVRLAAVMRSDDVETVVDLVWDLIGPAT